MAHHSIDVLVRDIIYLLKHSAPEIMRKYFHTLTRIFGLVPASQDADVAAIKTVLQQHDVQQPD